MVVFMSFQLQMSTFTQSCPGGGTSTFLASFPAKLALCVALAGEQLFSNCSGSTSAGSEGGCNRVWVDVLWCLQRSIVSPRGSSSSLRPSRCSSSINQADVRPRSEERRKTPPLDNPSARRRQRRR